MGFNIEKMRDEVRRIEKENKRNVGGEKRGLTTLLNEAKNKQVKITLLDGEEIEGVMKKFSLYELQVDNKIIWKQAIKYMEVKR